MKRSTLIIAAGALFLLLACCSCCSSGVRVVASSRSIMSAGDINWDEYKIPVFSIYSGPHLTVWVNKDFIYLKSIAASGSVTNDVTAFGLYVSKEDKSASVAMEFAPLPQTNLETRIESDVK